MNCRPRDPAGSESQPKGARSRQHHEAQPSERKYVAGRRTPAPTVGRQLCALEKLTDIWATAKMTPPAAPFALAARRSGRLHARRPARRARGIPAGIQGPEAEEWTAARRSTVEFRSKITRRAVRARRHEAISSVAEIRKRPRVLRMFALHQPAFSRDPQGSRKCAAAGSRLLVSRGAVSRKMRIEASQPSTNPPCGSDLLAVGGWVVQASESHGSRVFGESRPARRATAPEMLGAVSAARESATITVTASAISPSPRTHRRSGHLPNCERRFAV